MKKGKIWNSITPTQQGLKAKRKDSVLGGLSAPKRQFREVISTRVCLCHAPDAAVFALVAGCYAIARLSVFRGVYS